MFFFTTEFAKNSFFFTLPDVSENEIVRSTSVRVEGKSGFICLVRYIRNCWSRRVSQFLVRPLKLKYG